MRPDHEEAVANGRIIKTNTFITERGSYKIDIIAHNGSLFFYKSKNDTLVECINLTEKATSKN